MKTVPPRKWARSPTRDSAPARLPRLRDRSDRHCVRRGHRRGRRSASADRSGALRISATDWAGRQALSLIRTATPDPYCSRGTLDRVEGTTLGCGNHRVVGHQREFRSSGRMAAAAARTCGRSTGSRECSSSKGSSGTSPTPRRVGVTIEQFHPEYGRNQFEIHRPHSHRSPRRINWC